MNTCFPKLTALVLIFLVFVGVGGAFLVWRWTQKLPTGNNTHLILEYHRDKVIQELERKNRALAVRKALREYDQRSMRLKAIRDEWGLK